PMGYLTYSRTESNGAKINNATPTSEVTEQPRYDALGNQISRSTQSSFDLARYGRTTTVSEVFRYHPGTGRLRAKNTAVHGDTLVYDAAGNLVWETYTTPGLTASDDFRDHAYFYDAEGRLRASDTRTVDDPTNQLSNYSRAFEEYRYDALGRRVLVRARRECNQDQYSALCELGWLRRTIWDGEQELIEIQAPGGQQPYYSQYMENDTAHVNLALANGSPPDWYTVDPNPFYGRVLYVHGLSLDYPLALVRMGYGDRLDTANVDRGYRAVEPYVIVPHWNSRGQAVLGTYDDGGWRRCQWLSGYKRCNFLQWPEMWAGYARPDMRENAWHGTLITDKADGSGLSYRRNRYYDPSSGRFTQEDPIGLAGGMNVYGFAEGDPVNYSDPYGLCANGIGRDYHEGNCRPSEECAICLRLLLGALRIAPQAAVVTVAGARLLSGGLRAHERLGGHTIAQHVTTTLPRMATRLARNPNLTSVSRFFDLRHADASVQGALVQNSARIQSWLSGNAPDLAFNHAVGRNVGEILHRGASSPVPGSVVRLFLVRNPASPVGYHVHTAYVIR
ncbi:MAG TPA: RNase A-like domain-containing protein, partial [Longimicrobium sp.]|nr:RNase A-like domain-containing protein [Longimicrobium sp.]